MDSLFSHAHEPEYLAPQSHQEFDESVILGVPAEHAFDGFSDGIHLWWPVVSQSIFGEGSHVALLRDHLVEESLDGDEVVWADVVEWEAGSYLRLHWTLGQAHHGPYDVDISFEPLGQQMSRVRIQSDDVVTTMELDEDEFDCDWSLILSSFARFMGGPVSLD